MNTGKTSKFYAVLTGDIVRSRELSTDELGKLKLKLRDCVTDLNTLRDGLVCGDIDFFRGDAWQMLINYPEQSFRAALYVRSYLLAYMNCDTRVGIGIGPISETVHDRIARLGVDEGFVLAGRSADENLALGSAFTLSGHVLDEMSPKVRMDLDADLQMHNITSCLKLVVQLCDAIVGHWKPRQSAAVLGALKGLTQIEIAEELSITQQAVGKSLAGSDWNAVEMAIRWFEGVGEVKGK